MAIPTAPIAAGSLVAGYAVASSTGVRPLGGLVMLGAGAVCARQWQQAGGWPLTLSLSAVLLGALVVSHPLAKQVGAWPSVLSVAGVAAAVTYLAADRRSGADRVLASG